eukprot:1634640-Amphidinium_carterae.2
MVTRPYSTKDELNSLKTNQRSAGTGPKDIALGLRAPTINPDIGISPKQTQSTGVDTTPKVSGSLPKGCSASGSSPKSVDSKTVGCSVSGSRPILSRSQNCVKVYLLREKSCEANGTTVMKERPSHKVVLWFSCCRMVWGSWVPNPAMAGSCPGQTTWRDHTAASAVCSLVLLVLLLHLPSLLVGAHPLLPSSGVGGWGCVDHGFPSGRDGHWPHGHSVAQASTASQP